MGTLQYGTLGFIRYYKTQIEARAAFVLFSFPLVLILLNSRCRCTLASTPTRLTTAPTSRAAA